MSASLGDSVAVIAAMVPELRPTIRRLGLRRIDLDGIDAHEGRAAGREVIAVVTSMGTAAATDVTTRLLDRRSVDHVIVIGICGGIDPDLPIGSLVVPAETVVEHTGGTGRPAALAGHTALGRLLTTDILHTDPAEVAALRADGFAAVDMETGAIGAVCDDRDIPWSVFRAVSDRAGDPAVDAELVAMSAADGTARPGAVLRYMIRHPLRLRTLAALGGGMRAAVATSTDALLAALES